MFYSVHNTVLLCMSMNALKCPIICVKTVTLTHPWAEGGLGLGSCDVGLDVSIGAAVQGPG